jgi:hypothetical protein
MSRVALQRDVESGDDDREFGVGRKRLADDNLQSVAETQVLSAYAP